MRVCETLRLETALGTPLCIGPVELATNLLLAPIANYCDLAFRIICREQGGVGLACTDLLSPQGLIRGTRQSLDLARTNDLDRPVGMQLYGSDPDIMADGARWAADHGATVVDINMGCPVDKVTKKDGGSKLMCDFEKATTIVRAVRAALPEAIPLTAKMRLGWSCTDDAPRLACLLVDAGVAAVTVHGRTTEQKFRGEANWDAIGDVVDAVASKNPDVPVIGNGDVRCGEDAIAMLERTGCAGVMIGRGALSRPWIFHEAWVRQTTDGAVAPPSESEKLAIVRRFFQLMRTYRDDHYAMTHIRRRISWFAREINGSHCRPLKEAVRLASAPEDVHRALDDWEAGDLRRAVEVS